MNRLALEAVAIVGGSFIIALAMIFVAPRGKPTAQPVSIGTPTAQPTMAPVIVQSTAAPPPTQPPAPTAAPPKPQAAEKPAAKPSGPSPHVRAYLDWALPNVQIAGRAMGGLGSQAEAAGKNPRLVADAEWRTKTAVALAFMKSTGEDLQRYPGEVTPELARLDGLMKGIGRDLVASADEFAGGLDQGSVARINTSTARMNAATQKLTEATAEVDKLER